MIRLIRLPNTMVDSLDAVESPWTDDEFRAFLGQLGIGVGCIETVIDENGDEIETGYLIWYHDMTDDDYAIILVLTAAYEWVTSAGSVEELNTRREAMGWQAAVDRAKFIALKQAIHDGLLSKDMARSQVKAEMLVQADTFNVLDAVEKVYNPPREDEFEEPE